MCICISTMADMGPVQVMDMAQDCTAHAPWSRRACARLARSKTLVSPFNFGTIAAFLAWFGGAGYLATNYYRAWFVPALGIALVSGLAGGSIVFWFLAKVLMGREEHLDPANYEMVGVLGTVSGLIRQGGTGEILFSQEGSRRAAAARSEDGKPIPRGVEVVVTRFENGISYVRRWDELKAESDAMSGEKKDRVSQ